MIARSTDRVPSQTDEQINQQIHRHTEMSIEYFRAHPQEIPQRLRQLDSEWDIERMLETASASLSLFGLVRGILGRRRWFLLPLIVQGFFLQHALQGWCPPLPVLRRLGFRTPQEIEEERCALESIRGNKPRTEARRGRSAQSRE
jgi:hypothetical protein